MQLLSLPLNPNCSWTGTGGSAGLAVAVSLLVPGILRASKRLDFGLLKLRTVSSLWCFVSSEESLGLFPHPFEVLLGVVTASDWFKPIFFLLLLILRCV